MQWGNADDVGGHPTMRLLRTYLDTFLPQSQHTNHSMYLPTAML